jgi:hypothetical protein
MPRSRFGGRPGWREVVEDAAGVHAERVGAELAGRGSPQGRGPTLPPSGLGGGLAGATETRPGPRPSLDVHVRLNGHGPQTCQPSPVRRRTSATRITVPGGSTAVTPAVTPGEPRSVSVMSILQDLRAGRAIAAESHSFSSEGGSARSTASRRDDYTPSTGCAGEDLRHCPAGRCPPTMKA